MRPIPRYTIGYAMELRSLVGQRTFGAIFIDDLVGQCNHGIGTTVGNTTFFWRIIVACVIAVVLRMLLSFLIFVLMKEG